jgi:hypothetical protein
MTLLNHASTSRLLIPLEETRRGGTESQRQDRVDYGQPGKELVTVLMGPRSAALGDAAAGALKADGVDAHGTPGSIF